jgi:hypothetical protein
MADKKKITSVKHLQISKSQSSMLGVIVAATAIAVFGLFATKALIVKGAYQRRALHARRQVVDQLKDNYKAANQLFNQYQVFASQDPNVIGGKATDNGSGSSSDITYKCSDGTTVIVPQGVTLNDADCKPVDKTKSGSTGSQDGNNPQIVLDALPSTYDAPALASSIEKILSGQQVAFESLAVTDDPSANSDQAQANPQSKAIPFQFEGNTTFDGGKKLLQDFERSIRPFDLNTLEITGTDQKLRLKVGMTTYFQPSKSLDLQATKEVK